MYLAVILQSSIFQTLLLKVADMPSAELLSYINDKSHLLNSRTNRTAMEIDYILTPIKVAAKIAVG
jgi:hypothetical protein